VVDDNKSEMGDNAVWNEKGKGREGGEWRAECGGREEGRKQWWKTYKLYRLPYASNFICFKYLKTEAYKAISKCKTALMSSSFIVTMIIMIIKTTSMWCSDKKCLIFLSCYESVVNNYGCNTSDIIW